MENGFKRLDSITATFPLQQIWGGFLGRILMKAVLVLIALCLLAGVNLYAQSPQSASASQQTGDPGITPNGAMGEVKAIDAAAKQMIVKTDAGSLVTVTLSAKSVYLRLAPGEKTL